jgi:putative hydrolase of the HAD superfamily
MFLFGKTSQLHPFDPTKAIFIDDTVAVLKGAESFGISKLFSILQPSSSKAARNSNELPYPHLMNSLIYLIV